MLISDMIKSLQDVLVENGDQELFMFVDTPDDTAYISKIPEIKINTEKNILKYFLNFTFFVL